jgi:hypothetical protein
MLSRSAVKDSRYLESKDLYINVYDLTAASDRVPLEAAKGVLLGFLEGSGRTSPYFKIAVEVLCSPHHIYDEKTHEEHVTNTGLLMGNPGTKEGMMLLFLCVDEIAKMVYKYPNLALRKILRKPPPKFEWDVMLIAGDDIARVGPRRLMELIFQIHDLLGHRIKREKTFSSRRAVVFCEEFLFFEDKVIAHGKPLWHIGYHNTIHIDALKVRIFSPCGKISSLAPEANPVIGKGQALIRKLPWLPEPWISMKSNLMKRWMLRMDGYIDWEDMGYFLPIGLGGPGLPYPFKPEAIVAWAWTKFPKVLLAIGLHAKGEAPLWVRDLLARMSSGGIGRGLEFLNPTNREMIHEQYVQMAAMAGHMLTEDELVKKFDLGSDFQSQSRSRRAMIARKLNYLTERSMDTLIEKTWIIKSAVHQAFYGDPTRSGIRKTPMECCQDFVKVESSYQKLQICGDLGESARSLLRVLKTGRVIRERPQRYISEQVISRHFRSLRTPFPFPAPSETPVVRGSVRDLPQNEPEKPAPTLYSEEKEE